MTTHKLKTINPYFTEAWNGFKNFEVRKDDRGFNKGDEVYLCEYDPYLNTYTGREIRCQITYILKNFEAVNKEYVVFSFKKTQHIERGNKKP